MAPGIDEVVARTRVALVLRHVRKKRKIRLASLARLDDDESEVEHARSVLRRRHRLAWASGPSHGAVMTLDVRDADEVEEEERIGTLVRYQAKKLTRILPGIGPGNSLANSQASRKRRTLVHRYPDGIYTHFCNIAWVGNADGFRQMTGFSQGISTLLHAEFLVCCTTGCRTTSLAEAPVVFAEARNNSGERSVRVNKQRRTIRGLLDDRDKVLCWLQILRRDQHFGDMEAM